MAQSAENYDGDIVLSVPREEVYSGIMRYAQMVGQISNLDILSRDIVSDLFYDDLEKVIVEDLKNYRFEKNYKNPKYTDLPIDYALLESSKPIYLFGAKDTNKANQITICCLNMINLGVSFRSVAVFNNIDEVTKFARNNLLNTATKVFSDVPGFIDHGPKYFENELGAA